MSGARGVRMGLSGPFSLRGRASFVRAVVWARMRRGTRHAASRSGLGGVGGLYRWALRVVVELSQGCICCPLIVISVLVVKNGRAADRMASASRFCGASCLIAVKQLAFYRTEMTYKRGKTRSDDPLRASNQPMWKPKRPPSVRRAYVFDRPSED